MRHVFRVFIFLFSVVGAGPVGAQNLVPNPSFETYSACPISVGQIALAPPWNTPTGGLSDYFNACYTYAFGIGGAGIPINIRGNQAAHSGNAYAGIILYHAAALNYRAYIQAPLLSPLVAGQSYKVSFYVSLADKSKWAIDGIGAYFSNGPVSQNGNVVLALTPQVSNLNGNVISNTTGWTLVQGNFVASGGESHIVIGNFKDDSNTNTANQSSGNAAYYDYGNVAYYYIDDVSVEREPVDLSIEKTSTTKPDPLNPNYNFQLTVKNLGPVFNGHNIITVTDTAPTGVAFTGVTASAASDWDCSAFTASSVTCVYIGTGPTASNQTIGTISIAATATFLPLPPLTANCATVALSAASGQVDSIAANNKACVLLPNQQEHCPPPMVPGFLPGQCVCPKGTAQQGHECVTICPPPKVPGPVLGVCVCPKGTVERNGVCVSLVNHCKPPKVPGPKPGSCICPEGTVEKGGLCVSLTNFCKPPKVPGPKPGSCICPKGTVERGGNCVSLADICKRPKVPGPKPGTCICPEGTVPRGKDCVKPTVCKPPAKLNRRGVCECPRDMVAVGDTCADRKRPPLLNIPGRIPSMNPRGGQDGRGPSR